MCRFIRTVFAYGMTSAGIVTLPNKNTTLDILEWSVFFTGKTYTMQGAEPPVEEAQITSQSVITVFIELY